MFQLNIRAGFRENQQLYLRFVKNSSLLSTKYPKVFGISFMIQYLTHIMFLIVVQNVCFQVTRGISWHNRFSIIISKQMFLIFTVLYIRKFLSFIFIPNIIYCITSVWNFRSINNFSTFDPDIIIILFLKDSNVPLNHILNETAEFLTFNDRFFIILVLNVTFSWSLFLFLTWIHISPNNNINNLFLLISISYSFLSILFIIISIVLAFSWNYVFNNTILWTFSSLFLSSSIIFSRILSWKLSLISLKR